MAKKEFNLKLIGICEFCFQVYKKNHPKQRWCHKHRECEKDREYVISVLRRRIRKKHNKKTKKEKDKKEKRQYTKMMETTNWKYYSTGACISCHKKREINRFGLCLECYHNINDRFLPECMYHNPSDRNAEKIAYLKILNL